MRTTRPLRSALAALALAGLVGLPATACSGAPDPGPVFDNEGGADVACMKHQPEAPGGRYTDPAQRDTAEVLTLMRYYTAHGAKAYCDGAPAGDADRQWGRAYLDLGGTPAKIATLPP